MSEWRPEGWVLPNGIGDETPPMAYEAGADAMLAALRAEHPCHVNAEGMSINFPLGVIKGSFVFIPDAPA